MKGKVLLLMSRYAEQLADLRAALERRGRRLYSTRIRGVDVLAVESPNWVENRALVGSIELIDPSVGRGVGVRLGKYSIMVGYLLGG